MKDEKKRKIEDYRRKRSVLDTKVSEAHMAVEEVHASFQHEMDRMDKTIYVAEHANIIIPNLEKQFRESTQLDEKDYTFLFFAIALQCARWYFQPKIDIEFKTTDRIDRHDAGKDGIIEKKERNRKLEELDDTGEKSNRNVTIKKMFLYPVPYDAMEGTARICIPGVSPVGKQLYGGNHHSATMGHDPILGYIFGTANIMTRTITFKNPLLQTCEVHLKQNTYLDPQHYSGQYVTKDVTKTELWDRFIGNIWEDPKRLPAGIARHIIHIESDKYCKDGLPIPFISAEDAQNLIKEDWNSNELERLIEFIKKDIRIVGVQAFFAALINVLIEQLHKFSYNEDSGLSKDLYSVKTHRILRISNIVASSSNIIYTALSEDISKLDIGGLVVALYRIWKDEKVIKGIKQEFVYGSYYDMLSGNYGR